MTHALLAQPALPFLSDGLGNSQRDDVHGIPPPRRAWDSSGDKVG
ncbi:Hypothetical protein AA314_01328 [Archangium gephyra]|uniref:Uncharacterized protein n=1 Tax=Archangium gephyra TaxID=48 RepID=A0AAC8TB81_9BACT|nr:Hypothetical protein AA314_01328 [Archangium gephyra]